MEPPNTQGGKGKERPCTNVRLNQHFRSSSGPPPSSLTHNRGMTRFCGRLIILDAHTHMTSTSVTRAWTTDTNADEHIPQHTHTDVYACMCTHTHT